MGGDVGAKNGDGDVEIAWDSSEVGADTEIEYVPLVRVEHPSLPSPQPNIIPLNQRLLKEYQFHGIHLLGTATHGKSFISAGSPLGLFCI